MSEARSCGIILEARLTPDGLIGEASAPKELGGLTLPEETKAGAAAVSENEAGVNPVRRKFRYVDPLGLPTAVIHEILNFGFYASHFDVVLGTAAWHIDEKGDGYIETTVSARLRFDIEMAKRIRDNIDRKIAELTAPPPPKDQVN